MKGKLYIVPTPIGNLADITYRAIDVLKAVDAILAEDTRQTKKLLDHYNIKQKLIPYHQHNELKNSKAIIERICNGDSLAVCSDAGMPGISDPGFLLIREAIKADIKVITLPGAVAAIVPQTAESQERQIEEVVVSATKKDESASKVAVTVTALTEETLKEADYLSLKFDLTRQVKETFDAEGIEIPFPTTTILTSKD